MVTVSYAPLRTRYADSFFRHSQVVVYQDYATFLYVLLVTHRYAPLRWVTYGYA